MKRESCINYLLTVAQHNVFMEMKDVLKNYDITPVQFSILKCIWDDDIHNPKDIAETLFLENSTVSGIVERLETKGLLKRTTDSKDRRYIYLELAPKSEELQKIVDVETEKVHYKTLEDFSEEESRMLISLLQKYVKIESE